MTESWRRTPLRKRADGLEGWLVEMVPDSDAPSARLPLEAAQTAVAQAARAFPRQRHRSGYATGVKSKLPTSIATARAAPFHPANTQLAPAFIKAT